MAFVADDIVLDVGQRDHIGSGENVDTGPHVSARIARDGVPERDLLRWIFRETAGAILKPTSSGEQITMRELRKARALLSKRGRWPKLLG